MLLNIWKVKCFWEGSYLSCFPFSQKYIPWFFSKVVVNLTNNDCVKRDWEAAQCVSAVNNCFLHCQTKHTSYAVASSEVQEQMKTVMNIYFFQLLLYKDTKVHLAKVAKQFKATRNSRCISMPWVCCLDDWVCVRGLLVWFVGLFPWSNHSCCAPIKLLSEKTLSETFFMFYVFCLVRTLPFEFLGMLNKIIA